MLSKLYPGLKINRDLYILTFHGLTMQKGKRHLDLYLFSMRNKPGILINPFLHLILARRVRSY